MSSRFATLLAAVLLALPLAAQSVQLDDAIPGGNLVGWSDANGVLTVHEDLPAGTWQWLFFRATGVAGLTPDFRTPLTNTGDVYRSYHRMAWRYAGERDWRLMDRGWLPGDGHYWFACAQPFSQDVVEIAYWYPYGLDELRRFGRRLAAAGTPWLRAPRSYGRSHLGRGLKAVTITDSSVPDGQKKTVVILARQHGCETLGNYAVEGMVRFLVGPSPEAEDFRKRAIVHVYPMINPDAADEGWTREGLDKSGLSMVDFNRDWLHGSAATGGAPSSSYEIDALRDDLVAVTGASADFLIDVHSHPKGSQGLGWYWWYQGDPVPAQAVFQAVWDADQADHPSDPIFSWPSHPAGPGSTTAMDWGGPTGIHQGTGTLDGLGLTLEPIAAPFGTVRSIERVRAGGETVLRGLLTLL